VFSQAKPHQAEINKHLIKKGLFLVFLVHMQNSKSSRDEILASRVAFQTESVRLSHVSYVFFCVVLITLSYVFVFLIVLSMSMTMYSQRRNE
jgi:hypothetical protein